MGSGGYFGPPNSEGEVKIGYSVLSKWQRRGYATETVNSLVSYAFFLKRQKVLLLILYLKMKHQ